jgi:hypothetical protein
MSPLNPKLSATRKGRDDAGLDFASCPFVMRTETLAVRLEFFQPFINAVPYSTKCGLVVTR